MNRSIKVLALLLMFLTLAAGCRTVTGRSLGTTVDDRTTHASLKSRLAADRLQNLTWVGVDVSNGIANLSGNVETEMQKQRAENIARGTAGVRGVVNNIMVTPRGVAHTQDVGDHAGTQAGLQPSAQVGATQQPGVVEREAQAQPAASPAGREVLARQTLNAEVRDVNRTTGHVRLDTPEGRMDLNVPQETARSLVEGDRVTVEMVIRSAR